MLRGTFLLKGRITLPLPKVSEVSFAETWGSRRLASCSRGQHRSHVRPTREPHQCDKLKCIAAVDRKLISRECECKLHKICLYIFEHIFLVIMFLCMYACTTPLDVNELPMAVKLWNHWSMRRCDSQRSFNLLTYMWRNFYAMPISISFF